MTMRILIGKNAKRGEYVVASLGEAVALYEQLRDESGEGATTWPTALVKAANRVMGTISYNGRFWPGEGA